MRLINQVHSLQLANTDKSNLKENNKRRREISEKERAMHEEKRQVRRYFNPATVHSLTLEL